MMYTVLKKFLYEFEIYLKNAEQMKIFLKHMFITTWRCSAKYTDMTQWLVCMNQKLKTQSNRILLDLFDSKFDKLSDVKM